MVILDMYMNLQYTCGNTGHVYEPTVHLCNTGHVYEPTVHLWYGMYIYIYEPTVHLW